MDSAAVPIGLPRLGPWEAWWCFLVYSLGQFAGGLACGAIGVLIYGFTAGVNGLADMGSAAGRSGFEAWMKLWIIPPSVPIGLAVGFLFVTLFARRYFPGGKFDLGREQLGLVRVSGRTLLLGAMGGVTITVCFLLLLVHLFPVPKHEPGPLAQIASSSSLGLAMWVLTAIAVAPPIEEFVFRGLVFSGFTRGWGIAWGTFAMTVLFVSLHVPEIMHNVPASISITTMAIWTAALRVRTGSIYPGLASHLAYNGSLAILVSLSRVLSG